MKSKQQLKNIITGLLCTTLIFSNSAVLSAAQNAGNISPDTSNIVCTDEGTEGTESMNASEGSGISTENTEEPAETPESSTESTEEPAETPESSTESTEEPAEAPESSTESAEEPAEIPESSTESTEEPAETPESSTESAEEPIFAVPFSEHLLDADSTSLERDFTALKSSIVDNYYVINVKSSDITAQGTYRAIQTALDEAQANATDKLPYKIIVDPGTYKLDRSFHIYSNTYLYMKGVTFTQEKGLSSNMMKVGETTDTQSGYYYRNITMEGGVWDENGNSNTAIKVGHTYNFTMLNQTVKNVKNAHLMEVAGVDTMTLKGCTFADQNLAKDNNGLFYEAIQIDILVDGHITGFRSEDLPMKNLNFDSCKFSNVPRGIGSHTAVLNSYVDNVQITNCTFSDIKSAAIQSMNWKNCTITNNTITNAPRGIAIYSIRDESTYLSSSLAKEGNVASSTPTTYVAPDKNQNIVIQNNTITCNGSDPYADYEDVGIFLGGVSFSKVTKGSDGDKIPAGDYYLSGVTVSNNTISTIGHGIRLEDTKNSTVKDNTINYTGGNSNTSYHGIQLREASTNNAIDNNKISSAQTNGIYLYTGSSASSISNNQISASGKYGIDIENAKADTISGNTISGSKTNGIYIYNKSSVAVITDNTISSSGVVSVNIDNASVGTLSQNAITTASSYGIYLHNNATVDNISKNTLKSIKKHGIFVAGSTATTISGNTIASPTSNGIYIYNKGTAKTISENTISSPGKYGIDVENATGTTISKNTVTKPVNHGIIVQQNGKTKKITENKVSSGKKSGISIGTIKQDLEISSNTISKCSKPLIYLNPATTSYTITVTKNTLTGTSSVTGIYADSGKLDISGNTVKSAGTAMILSKNAKGTVGLNTLSKNKNNSVVIGSTNYKNLAKPTSVKAVKKSKTSITVSWKKTTNAAGYIVYRSTSKDSGYKKCTTLSGKTKVKYTDTKLKTGKTYYYKVVAYRKSSNGNMTILGSESKVVSKKL